MRLQRRIAYVAPATALATNMHCYWMGVAADLLKRGDESCRWVLEAGAAGKVFCALHGEAGNDMLAPAGGRPAERVDGGWEDLGPQELREPHPGLGLRRGSTPMDASDPANPQIVHGFLDP